MENLKREIEKYRANIFDLGAIVVNKILNNQNLKWEYYKLRWLTYLLPGNENY